MEDSVGRAFEAELRQRYRILNAAFSANTDFIYVFDLRGRFVFANRALCDLLHRSPEEMVGQSFHDLHYPEPLASNLQSQIQEVIRTREVIRAETPFTSPDGRTEIYEYIFCPVFDELGEVEAVTGTTRNITEHHNVQVQLVDVNQNLQRLFSQAPGFMAVLRGPDHVVQIGNTAYMELIGFRDIVGKPLAGALPEAEEQGFVKLLDEVLTTGEPIVGRAMRYDVPRDRGEPPKETYVDFVYQPIFDEAKNAIGVFVQGHDVTEQHMAQLALLEADRQKDRFIATLAHELRNPLAPIRTGARVLRSPDLSPAALDKMTEIIIRQVGHMSRLLDDLLDVSRLSNSQMRLQKEPVTVGALVAMAVEATRSQIEQKRHRLSITHRDGAITLEADPVRMTQVLSNLVGNAAKYTDAGGTLSVESCVRDGNCVISVVDSGIGLEDTRNVFTMFTQEKAAIDRSEGGLGIGLALVKGLVELHGGWVRAHSPGLGQGSTFEVGLPHSASLKAGTDRPETTFKPIAKMSPKRVLIADDNSDAVTVLRDVLELMGHSVSVAHDGVNALALGNEVRPEVAILDIGMPGLNGFELARSIRGQGWGHRAILIAATGWGHDEAKREALLAGFDGHLTKPFTVEQLEALLNQL